MDENNHGTRSRPGARERQMRDKLTEMGIYEEGMSPTEMMDLIKVLDSSKHDISHSGSLSPPPVEPVEVQHQMSFEYEDQTPQNNQRSRDTSSPNQRAKKNHFSTPNDEDSDDAIFDPNEKYKRDNNADNSQKNHQLPVKSYSNIVQQKNTGTRIARILSKVDNTQIDMWRMQPFEDELTQYVPLKSVKLPNPPVEPMKITVINNKAVVPHEKIAEIKKHLEDVINIWQKWELDTTEEAEFRWGTPIQAGVEKVDAPKFPQFEYKPLPTPDPVENESRVALRADDSYSNNPPSTRPHREQALKTYDFEDDDPEFQPKASKRLKNSGLRSHPPIKRKGIAPLAGTSRQKKCDFIDDDDDDYKVDVNEIKDDDDDDDGGWISSDTKPQNKGQKKLSIGLEIDINQIPDTEYSRRRITPPNPSKPKNTRGKKAASAAGKSNQNQLPIFKVNSRVRETNSKDEEMDTSEAPVKQSGRKLTDKQIADELMENISDDEEFKKKEEINDQELAKVRASLSVNRVEVSITRLKKKQEIQKTIEDDAKVAEELKRQMEVEDKERRITARLLKVNDETRAQEEAEKLQKEKEERYRNIAAKPRVGLHERNELRSDGDTLRPVDQVAWDPRADAQPLSTNRNVARTTGVQRVAEKVNCPICKKLFLSSEIAAHASTCDEFVESDGSDVAEVIENTPSPVAASQQCGSDSGDAITITDSPVRNSRSEIETPEASKSRFKPKQPSGKGTPNSGRKRKR